MAKDQGTKNLMIAIGIVVLAFVVLFSVKLIIKDPKPDTPSGLVVKTLEGEENPETNYMYNGFVFVKNGPLWQTQWRSGNKQYNIMLHHGPKELENITITGDIDDRFHSDEVYVTFNPLGNDLNYVALSAGELSLSLVRALNVMPIASCDRNETPACKIRPIVNCINTDSAVIYLKEDPEAKVDLKGNCIVLQGKGKDIIKVTDRLILQWYGIMQGR